ncbi:MAG: DUF3830 family protein [Candidatus Acetothermia bacterium]|jgi:hypothetical protein|nr:DUF3830 family protein [Candidatus Acetothermia bacterium]MDH7505451.1 cyclophilin-like fold protein [Candidatus Acetothermia bacterium]
MQPKIAFRFERGGELVAELLAESAPQTAAAVLKMLPLEATVYHTRWCGREIYLPVRSKVHIPRENQTVQTNTGDVIYWREWEKDGSQAAEALSIYYGAEVVRDHRGYLPVNVFARVPSTQWKIIEEVGLRVWQHGIEKVSVTLLER